MVVHERCISGVSNIGIPMSLPAWWHIFPHIGAHIVCSRGMHKYGDANKVVLVFFVMGMNETRQKRRYGGIMNDVRRTCCVIAVVFIFLIIGMPVSAQGGPGAGAGQGSGAGYGGESAGPENISLQERVSIQEQTTARISECGPDEACNATHLRAMVAYRNQVYQADADSAVPPVNVTGRAVYAFRAAAPLNSASSPDLIRLAEEVNGSVRNAVQNEAQIRSQNAFMVFLFGGDKASADAIMQHVIQNRVRIEEMNRLIDGCGCDPETAAILREQVQAMEQEQARFEELAASEKARRGLFGMFG